MLQLHGQGHVHHRHDAQGVQSELQGPSQASHPLPLLPHRPLHTLQGLRGQRLYRGVYLVICAQLYHCSFIVFP